MSYEELDTRIGQLKKSAIDAFMREAKTPGWRLNGNRYEQNSRGTDFTVTAPGPDGEGGGDWSASDFLGDFFGLIDRDDEFIQDFNTIRESVSSLTSRWKNLPDPADFEGVIAESRDLTNRLAGASSVAGNGVVNPEGELIRSVELMMSNVDKMQGLTIGQFKSKFVFKLADVIGAYHQLSAVRGGHIAAEQGIWEAARKDVMAILDNAKASFDAIAQGGQFSWSQTLEVAGWATKGLEKFTAGGAKTAVEVAGLGIQILTANTTSQDVATPTAGFYDTMTSLEAKLQALADQIAAEENAIADNIVANLDAIAGEKSKWDITQPEIYDGGEIASISRPLIEEISGVYMNDAETELKALGQLATGGSIRTESTRDATLGRGANGPATEVWQMSTMQAELLKDLGWEVGQGAEQLIFALEDWERADADSQAALERINLEVTSGSPYDPWD